MAITLPKVNINTNIKVPQIKMPSLKMAIAPKIGYPVATMKGLVKTKINMK